MEMLICSIVFTTPFLAMCVSDYVILTLYAAADFIVVLVLLFFILLYSCCVFVIFIFVHF